MSNTLGLDDDLDPVEARISLEKAFALKLDDDAAASCNTVGDLYNLLNSHFSTQIGEPGSCMTSMAFYRLRRSLRTTHPGIDFRPDTQLAACAGRNARGFLNRLQSDSGLDLPAPRGRWLSWLGWVLLPSAIVTAAIIASISAPPLAYLAALALLVTGWVSLRVDPGALPRDCATLGNLARKASVLNYGTLARSGGAVRPNELWEAMTEVLLGASVLSKSDMRRDTLILG